jgi:pyruvyl transferase EpsI
MSAISKIAGILKSVASFCFPHLFVGHYDIGRERKGSAIVRFREIRWARASPPRIIYALTPTEDLRNVGDHAQVVAILRWMERHFPGIHVVELDKDVVISCIDSIADEVRLGDLIILHSGGNLGDRGQWSEAGRRLIISKLTRNRIVSLPQTIFFSRTVRGELEKRISKAVYARHRSLTVLGRDAVSGRLASQLFPHNHTASCPDFVLSLDLAMFRLDYRRQKNGRALACLRLDNESVLSAPIRAEVIESVGMPCTVIDTTIDEPIQANRRAEIVGLMLEEFLAHDVVVTDRYHGLIFAVLCRKPVVVLPTIDHKLTSAFDWFKDVGNVVFCSSAAEVHDAVLHASSVIVTEYPNFNKTYFDELPKTLGNYAELFPMDNR